MNKLKEIKLAIYERCTNGEITKEECDILLEKAEERYAFDTELTEDEKIAVECVMDGSMTVEEVLDLDEPDEGIVEESESAEKINKVANEASDALKRHVKTVKIMKEAQNKYKKNEKNIKTFIKEKKYQEAKKSISECESSIKVIKSSIESIKDQPSDAVVEFVFNTGKYFAINTLVEFVTNSIIKSSAGFQPKTSIKKNLINSAGMSALAGAYNKVSKGNWNSTRADALKALNNQLMGLKKLSNKIDKLSSDN